MFKVKVRVPIRGVRNVSFSGNLAYVLRRRSGLFVVNFEHISHLFLVFLLLTLNKQILAGKNVKGGIRI